MRVKKLLDWFFTYLGKCLLFFIGLHALAFLSLKFLIGLGYKFAYVPDFVFNLELLFAALSLLMAAQSTALKTPAN